MHLGTKSYSHFQNAVMEKISHRTLKNKTAGIKDGTVLYKPGIMLKLHIWCV